MQRSWLDGVERIEWVGARRGVVERADGATAEGPAGPDDGFGGVKRPAGVSDLEFGPSFGVLRPVEKVELCGGFSVMGVAVEAP
jgi:hypothetical protein